MGMTDYINQKKEQKKILLMAHQILGYPGFEANEKMLDLFQQYDVDLLELQIPFSDPVADGTTFLKANQDALENGTTIDECFNWIEKFCKKYSFPILIMTYYNIIFHYGVDSFVKRSKNAGIKGFIVPDAMPENCPEYLEACKKYGMNPIFIATPYTKEERLDYINSISSGFIYCVPRKGVTGIKTDFNTDTNNFLSHCRKHISLPLGVGFGIQNKEDIASLEGEADIAIIGSHFLRLLEREGLRGVENFLKSLK